VSNFGRVRNIKTGHIHTGALSNKGYRKVCIYIKNYKSVTKLVHSLVLNSFYPNPNSELYNQINHIDCNKDNNRLDNLEWSNNSLNQKHAFKNGLKFNHGEHGPTHKLKEIQVLEILRLLKYTNLTQKEIGKQFNVKGITICAIKCNRIWKHIDRNSI
jgi:hypothetical protein